MPRTKLDKKPDNLTRLIRGVCPTYKSFGDVIGCTIPTAKVKVENPEKITIEELRMLCRRTCITADEIRAAINF